MKFVILLLLFINSIVFSETKDEKVYLKDLDNKDYRVRIEAARNLSKTKTVQVEKELQIRLKNEDNPSVKYQIMDTLRIYKTTHTKQALIESLDDKDPGVRQTAAFYLADLGLDEDTLILMVNKLTEENDENVKLAMLNTIEKYVYVSTTTLIPALAKMLDVNQPKSVRTYTAEILKNIPQAKHELEKYKHDAQIGEIIRKQ